MSLDRKVSIVIPAYNEERALPHLLAALRRQTYPAHLTEIIVVDNRSTDGTSRIARAAGVIVLREDRLPSSDLARNQGIARATGEVIAFTDSDCRPEPDWLEKLVAAVPPGRRTVAAGRIMMELPESPSAAAVYDSMSFLKHENSVPNRKIAFTANLAVDRRSAVEVGGVPMKSVTCGDSYFARHLYHLGCDMVYVPEAVVRHPVRNFRQLCSKVKLIARANATGGDKDAHLRSLRPGDYRKGLRAVLTMPHIRALNPLAIVRHLRIYGQPAPLSLVIATWCVAVYVLTLGCLVTFRQKAALAVVREQDPPVSHVGPAR